jgi:hypothetical protein
MSEEKMNKKNSSVKKLSNIAAISRRMSFNPMSSIFEVKPKKAPPLNLMEQNDV